MNENKILHVMILDKFLAPYIDFVDENFGRENHHYVFITSEKYEYGLTPEHKVEFLYTDDDIFITLLEYMKMAKKIILHGLWRDKVDILLYFNQKLLKKCYWIMWGGDYYFPEKQSWMRHKVIKEIGYLVNGAKNEYVLVKKWYNSNGQYIKINSIYPSNLYKELPLTEKKCDTINILLGNSATQTNNHIEILLNLETHKNKNIKVFTPLSYGDSLYGKEVIAKGNEILGDKFIPILNFMAFEKYLEFLNTIDIALFAHNRAQGTGNIINLLGLGKKVYMRNDVIAWNFFKEELGLNLFNIENIELDILDEHTKLTNIKIIKNYFSKENIIKQWKELFNKQ